MCPVNHGRFGPTEKETVEIEPREENLRGRPKVNESREVFT